MDVDKIDFECPGCGRENRVSMDDIARQRTVRCPGGHSIKLTDEGGGVRKTKKALDDLERTIKKFGKR